MHDHPTTFADRYLTLSSVARFYSKFTKTDGCWLWQGHTMPSGHGRFTVGKQSLAAHRFAYELWTGPIPAGLLVRHLCNVPACINPDHLAVGTYAENMMDCTLAGRAGRRVGPQPAGQTAAERFWSQVDKTEACWLWTGTTLGKTGYGRAGLNGRQGYAHRIAYELTHGPIPAGLFVLHSCDQVRCCRPEHLRLGTHAENMAEQHQRKRHRFGERHPVGKLTEDDVRDIRRRHAAGQPQKEIARRYGLNPVSIWDIVHGYHWQHVDPDPNWKPDGTSVGYARGERHGSAKLTAEQVREIRRRYAAGGVSQDALGREYGVTQSAIGLVIRRVNWPDLE